MEIVDTEPYKKAMEEIKLRADVIKACLDGRAKLSGPPRIESAALQLRMIFELIALASLAANKELFAKQSQRFEKHWHPSAIIKNLEKINPNFYPEPISVSEPDSLGIRTHDRSLSGYLTKEELVEAHGKLGNILHSRNPFAKKIDYEQYAKQIILLTNKVVALLATHQIRLLGDEHFYFVLMAEHDRDVVCIYPFQRVDA